MRTKDRTRIEMAQGKFGKLSYENGATGTVGTSSWATFELFDTPFITPSEADCSDC